VAPSQAVCPGCVETRQVEYIDVEYRPEPWIPCRRRVLVRYWSSASLVSQFVTPKHHDIATTTKYQQSQDFVEYKLQLQVNSMDKKGSIKMTIIYIQERTISPSPTPRGMASGEGERACKDSCTTSALPRASSAIRDMITCSCLEMHVHVTNDDGMSHLSCRWPAPRPGMNSKRIGTPSTANHPMPAMR
jgi:hypothetical protein